MFFMNLLILVRIGTVGLLGHPGDSHPTSFLRVNYNCKLAHTFCNTDKRCPILSNFMFTSPFNLNIIVQLNTYFASNVQYVGFCYSESACSP